MLAFKLKKKSTSWAFYLIAVACNDSNLHLCNKHEKGHFISAIILKDRRSMLGIGFHSPEEQSLSWKDRATEEQSGSPWCPALCETQAPFRIHDEILPYTQSHLWNSFKKQKHFTVSLVLPRPSVCLPPHLIHTLLNPAQVSHCSPPNPRQAIQTSCGQCGRRSSCLFWDSDTYCTEQASMSLGISHVSKQYDMVSRSCFNFLK